MYCTIFPLKVNVNFMFLFSVNDSLVSLLILLYHLYLLLLMQLKSYQLMYVIDFPYKEPLKYVFVALTSYIVLPLHVVPSASNS